MRGRPRLLFRAVGDEYIVSVQGPIQLGEFSEPRPDLAVVGSREDLYRDSHPTAEDIVPLVEVCDTTLAYDRNTIQKTGEKARSQQAPALSVPVERMLG